MSSLSNSEKSSSDYHQEIRSWRNTYAGGPQFDNRRRRRRSFNCSFAANGLVMQRNHQKCWQRERRLGEIAVKTRWNRVWTAEKLRHLSLHSPPILLEKNEGKKGSSYEARFI